MSTIATTGPEAPARSDGVPDDRAWRRVRSASVVDALGSGLFVPLELLFLHIVVGLGLAAAGGVMSASALLGLVLLPVAGPALDRLGPRRLVLALGVTRFLALAGCVAPTPRPVVVVLLCLTTVADRWEHPAQASLVTGFLPRPTSAPGGWPP